MTAIWVLVAIAFCALLWLVLNGNVKRHMRKRVDQPLYPESLFKVIVTDADVISTHPDGTVERCPLVDLKELYIVTTSGGPWSPDVWWLFVGASPGTGCSFPGGATGEQDALQFAQQLPGFDNAAFTSAMGCTGDAKFLCWQAASNSSFESMPLRGSA